MQTLERGQIQIARIESDVLKRSGAELLTVQRSSPELGTSRFPPNIQVRKTSTFVKTTLTLRHAAGTQRQYTVLVPFEEFDFILSDDQTINFSSALVVYTLFLLSSFIYFPIFSNTTTRGQC